MVKLRYSSGNVISPEVHKIGILAIGSHLENHGPCLPIDTDAKISSYIALEASFRTGAKYLGVLYAATEYDYVKHGKHVTPSKLVEKRLIPTLATAKKCLELEKVVLVNGHGGNVPIIPYIPKIEKELNMVLKINNKIVEIEGPHAGTGELSIGYVLGIVDKSKLDEHCDFYKYPEVGMVGLKKAREINKGIDDGAKIVESDLVKIDANYGKKLLEIAIKDVIYDVKTILE
ncbi:MAG: 2-amino-5-formylamino-6-ribosylaminopyrimidin-4(3H)-one 5'-monophosphate deformylase [Methanomicrobiales archaeon]